jgi:murein L,D-transpeptidase YafK
VHVVTEDHRLWLCAGTSAQSYRVRLGMGGVGKQREGDRKVPLGRYTLYKPRASATYGLFIPIGYPTAKQREQGLTGGAVGIHGPGRRLRWLGVLNNLLDTTDGCLGVATDPEMAAIAEWTRLNRAASVLIEVRGAPAP